MVQDAIAPEDLIEAARQACVDAALDGYENARLSGLCHEGAWEAAVSAIRRADLGASLGTGSQLGPSAEAARTNGSLEDRTALLAREFASPGSPAAGSGAAATGAIAAGLVEWIAGHLERHGPASSRKRAGAIRGRAAQLQTTLASAAQHDADTVKRLIDASGSEASGGELVPAVESALEIASLCARAATLAVEVAIHTRGALRPDVAVAQQLAWSASHCALRLFEENLPTEDEPTEPSLHAKRRAWKVRLLLHRAAPLPPDALSGSEDGQPARSE